MVEVLLEYGCYGPRSTPVRGELWRASSYDRATDKRPAGSGDTPWEALAWWYVSVEETKRGILVMSRFASDSPRDVLARLGARSSMAPRTASFGVVPTSVSAVALTAVERLPGAAPSGGGATFSLVPSIPKSAAARRARTKNARKK